ncbi:uncharacterized protein LOC143247272 [Tachypleus tridentatus]|uniref:uncharacterized protein LOC143247272 n=1 Tax=Tachypleus tridentatus TaxID=6853 RepID=UPI003FD14CC2
MASTTIVNVGDPQDEESSSHCNALLCSSYVLGTLACCLIVGGIFLAFYRWDYMWLIVSVIGAVLVLIGSGIHFCGSKTSHKSRQKGKSRRPTVKHNHSLTEQLIPSAPPLTNACSASQLSLNMLPPYFSAFDTASVVSNQPEPSAPILKINGQNYLLFSVNSDLSNADAQSIVARLSTVLSNSTLDLLGERNEQPDSRDKQAVVQTRDQGFQTENNISSAGPKPPCNRHSFLQTVNGVISLQSREKQESKTETPDTSISISDSQSNVSVNEHINKQNKSSETTATYVPDSGTNNGRCQDTASGVDLNVSGSQDPSSNMNQISLEPANEIDGVQCETVSEVLSNGSCGEQLTEAINDDIVISEALVADEGGHETNLDQEDLYDVPRQLIRPVEVDYVGPPNCNTITNLNVCRTNEPVGSINNDETSSVPRAPFSCQSSIESNDFNVTNDISESNFLGVSESTIPTSPKVVEPVTSSALTFVEDNNIHDVLSTDPVFEFSDICLQPFVNQPEREPPTESAVEPELRSPHERNDEHHSSQEEHNTSSTSTHIQENSNEEAGEPNAPTVEEHASDGHNLHERSQTGNFIASNPDVVMYASPIEPTLPSDLEDEDIRATPPPSYEEVAQDVETTGSSYNLAYGTI